MINRSKLFECVRRERSNAISPIIATLLLILIAIAAGVVVYAYVINFVGNSTNNSGATTSVISIDNFCVSKSSGLCTGSNGLYIVVRNTGTTTIPNTPSSQNVGASVYLTDVTAGTALTPATITCSDSASAGAGVAPGATYTCSASSSWTSEPSNVGDTITVKVVNPDGGSATATVKAIA
ncbi:MAG: archaellin/type IV pilin N-terminal domain-containing protein [Nitrososphaerales archaeon]